MDHKIWQRPPHTFERQLGKKKDSNDYQFKSCILGQKAGLLASRKKLRGWISPLLGNTGLNTTSGKEYLRATLTHPTPQPF